MHSNNKNQPTIQRMARILMIVFRIGENDQWVWRLGQGLYCCCNADSTVWIGVESKYPSHMLFCNVGFMDDWGAIRFRWVMYWSAPNS